MDANRSHSLEGLERQLAAAFGQDADTLMMQRLWACQTSLTHRALLEGARREMSMDNAGGKGIQLFPLGYDCRAFNLV